MRSRRFLFLAGVLVVLNLALWLAPQGLALRKVVVAQLFGPKLIRADVVWPNGQDWRVDRGVITKVDTTTVTLLEADGRTQSIGLSSETNVFGFGRVFPISALSPGWRVLVTWPANGSADSVKVERRAPPSGGSGGKGHSGSNG